MQTISITIQVPDEATVHVETMHPAATQPDNEHPQTPPPNLVERQLYARNLLTALKYQDPDAALSTFSAQRIIDVCTAARAQLTKLGNPAGYIHTTLTHGWNISHAGNGRKARKSKRSVPRGRVHAAGT